MASEANSSLLLREKRRSSSIMWDVAAVDVVVAHYLFIWKDIMIVDPVI
jgi:hypothetical protein